MTSPFRSLATLAAAAALLLSALATPVRADPGLSVSGYVTDGTTGGVLANVCVTLGPPIVCFTRTDGNGFYLIDLGALAARPGSTWDMYFLLTGYQTAYSGKFVVNGDVRFNQVLEPNGVAPLCPAADSRTPTQSVFIPNVTKTLGGPTGWQTPFIAQNTGSTATDLEVTYYRFLNGECAWRRTVSALGPGTSFADVPNNDLALPGDTQFAVVIRSFGSSVVSVVNEHAGTGSRAEAMSYTGSSNGATSVFLPNVVRRFFGYVSPFIVQDLGSADARVIARFVSFDGSAPTVTVSRTIPAGSSKFVDPNSDDATLGAPGLIDGKQYSVTVTSDQPITVTVNTQNDAPTVAAPVAYSTNGISAGAPSVYGPYAAKNAQGVGRVSTIVVQNMSSSAITPSLTFTPLGGGTPVTFVSPTQVAAGAAWAFDPRFTLGTTTPCSTASSTCLGDGEYTFVASSGGTANIAVAVNIISSATAMGYTGLTKATGKVYLPNVTRTLGGAGGWTTPILLQSAGATSAVLQWFRFSDGSLVTTQNVTIPSPGGVRVDPRDVAGLADNAQYAVVVTAPSGNIAAIVTELASGGDNAMTYEGFAQ